MASNTDLPRPFTVEYDPDEKEYFIFAPVGCVLVNGEAAEIVDAESGNVTLDIDPDDLPDYLYAHVFKNGDESYSVTFDGEENADGAKWNIRVVRFGADENDGNQYDILTSAINLGGGTGGLSNPGVYEIVSHTQSDGVVVHVFNNQYILVGGILAKTDFPTTLESLFEYAGSDGTLFVAVRISASPSVAEESIVGYPSFEDLNSAQRDTDYHTIPLYLLKVVAVTDEESGDVSYTYAITCDFRLGVNAQQWEVLW